MTWVLLTSLLIASTAAAQFQFPVRQRQDRRASLPATPAEPMLELYVAANNLTTAVFNASLDPASLVVDKTRFKWAEVSDHLLMLEPFADVGEKLIVQVGFKDRALPAKAVIAVVSKADVLDGKVEVDRRANNPESLLAALSQKEAELEGLKARCVGSGPASLALSGWIPDELRPIQLITRVAAGNSTGLEVLGGTGYAGTFSAVVVIHLRNLPGQKPWAPGQARLTGPAGAPVPVLSVQMKQERLAPGEEGLVAVETKTRPWTDDHAALRVELLDASEQRHFVFNLSTQ